MKSNFLNFPSELLLEEELFQHPVVEIRNKVILFEKDSQEWKIGTYSAISAA